MNIFFIFEMRELIPVISRHLLYSCNIPTGRDQDRLVAARTSLLHDRGATTYPNRTLPPITDLVDYHPHDALRIIKYLWQDLRLAARFGWENGMLNPHFVTFHKLQVIKTTNKSLSIFSDEVEFLNLLAMTLDSSITPQPHN